MAPLLGCLFLPRCTKDFLFFTEESLDVDEIQMTFLAFRLSVPVLFDFK